MYVRELLLRYCVHLLLCWFNFIRNSMHTSSMPLQISFWYERFATLFACERSLPWNIRLRIFYLVVIMSYLEQPLPVWVRICVVRAARLAKLFLQYSHCRDVSPISVWTVLLCWVSLWSWSSGAFSNSASHSIHLKGAIPWSLRRCLGKWSSLRNVLSHLSQLKGRSPKIVWKNCRLYVGRWNLDPCEI